MASRFALGALINVSGSSAFGGLAKAAKECLAQEDLANAELCSGRSDGVPVHLQGPSGHTTSVVVVEQRMSGREHDFNTRVVQQLGQLGLEVLNLTVPGKLQEHGQGMVEELQDRPLTEELERWCVG